jgi:pilus assembly protein CpaC
MWRASCAHAAPSLVFGAALAIAAAHVLAAPAHAQRIETRDLPIDVGGQETVSGQGVNSYSEGAPGIASVRLTPDGDFVVVGIRPGSTTLLLIYDDGRRVQYRVTVSDPNAAPTGILERENIRLDFYFIQLSENYGHSLGVSWPRSLGVGAADIAIDFDLSVPEISSATATIAELPLPRIDLLQASGWARIQRQASLITANGNQADFFGGEEVNIPVTAGLQGTLRTVSFGSRVGVTPRFDRNSNRLEVRIQAEVSDLTSGRGTGLPGRTVSTIDTLVNLEMGQAVVLAGLIAESRSATQSGLPGLSQIPILGPLLFGTHEERGEFTQNALFIVPSVVDVVSQEARQRIVDALAVYWDYRGGLSDEQLLPMPQGTPTAAHPDAIEEQRRNIRPAAPTAPNP